MQKRGPPFKVTHKVSTHYELTYAGTWEIIVECSENVKLNILWHASLNEMDELLRLFHTKYLASFVSIYAAKEFVKELLVTHLQLVHSLVALSATATQLNKKAIKTFLVAQGACVDDMWSNAILQQLAQWNLTEHGVPNNKVGSRLCAFDYSYGRV